MSFHGSFGSTLSWFLGSLILCLGACRPVPGVGDSCADAPCAIGLVCVEERCQEPEPPPVDPNACAVNEDCELNGSLDGRACEEGQCVFIACAVDAQCGERVCNRDVCAEREACEDNQDCGSGDVCEDGVCKSACGTDEECGGFSVCDEGRCFQQCFIDLMCFGDLCEDGVCVPPECVEDVDCPADGASYFCEAGRCVSYVPCVVDGDCFDADYRCSELGRCEERPSCRSDVDCGASALCLGGLCRPTDVCTTDEDCDDDKECLAAKCVATSECRFDGDCENGDRCLGQNCVAYEAPDNEDVDALALSFAGGVCESDGTGFCSITLFVGETLSLKVGAFDIDGAPVVANAESSSDNESAATATAVLASEFQINANAAGTALIRVQAGAGVHEALTIVVLEEISAGNAVLVVDEKTGQPIVNATVTIGDEAVNTDLRGVALYPLAEPVAAESWVSVQIGARGQAILVPSSTSLFRVLWPRAQRPASEAAGFRARVVSTGDETGALGIGLAISGGERLEDATLESLLGPPFRGALELPLLGAAPVDLPAAATMEASLPLLGSQVIREEALVSVAPGRRSAVFYEGRYPQGDLFGLVGGNDALTLALDLLQRAEGMDSKRMHVGNLQALPLVIDGDDSDGNTDVDGDGDIAERVPDYFSFPEIEVSPQQLARERVGLSVGALPETARARAVVAAGLLYPGYGFSPSGVGALRVSSDEAIAVQLKVNPPSLPALSAAERGIMMQAIFDAPGLESRLMYRGETFSSSIEMGTFLSPPTGAFVIEGIPSPDQRLLVLPAAGDADAYRVTLRSGSVQWTFVAETATGGRSLVLPDIFGVGALVEGVEVWRLDGADLVAPTLRPFAVGQGPRRAESLLRAMARAPGDGS